VTLRAGIATAVLALAAGLSGCAGATHAETAAAADTVDAADRRCEAFAEIPMGRYWINNNLWGQDAGSGTQCVEDLSQDGETIGWRTDWDWTGEPYQVKSYASAVLGWHWGWKAQDTGLPVRLAEDTPVPSAWDYEVATDGTAAVNYDLWLHETADPDWEDDPSDEVMIWLSAHGGAGPIGDRVDTVRVAGQSWDLHRGEILDDAGRHMWWVHSFVHTEGTTSFEADLADFTGALVERGDLREEQYLSSVQAGVEVFRGTGELTTRAYRTTVG
jgi:xyloglucan-specific endo-beta-1,4-glucanase